MNMEIHAFGAVYDLPEKGHDRVFIDDEHNFFGVFDGAGGAELSDASIQVLPKLIRKYAPVRQESQTTFLAQILAELDNLPEADVRTSTAAVACIDIRKEHTKIAYANFGDSSIYFLSGSDDRLRRIAHSRTKYIQQGPRQYISTEQFLGNCRSPEQIAQLIGRITVGKGAEWILFGFSDGIQDEAGHGLSPANLEHIVRSTTISDIPGQIIASVEKYDDASVFIVGSQPIAAPSAL
jgi:serine/threonine protein phosphatase PrpC